MKSLKEILDEHFVPAVGFKDRSMREQRNAAFAQMISFLDDIWVLLENLDEEEMIEQLEAVADEEHLFEDDPDEEETEFNDCEKHAYTWAHDAEDDEDLDPECF